MAELAKTPAGQARISAAANRLDRTAVDLGQQFRADVPQEKKEIMDQHLQAAPHSEKLIEFITMEPLSSKGQEPDVNVGTIPGDDVELRINYASQGPASSLGRPFQAVSDPQGDEGHEEGREQRIAADRGMDVDVVTESIAGSPPLAEDDRRVGPAVTERHQQVGSTESKLCGHDGSFPIAQGVSADQSKDDEAESDLKELLAVMTGDIRDEIKRHDEETVKTVRAMGGCAQRYRRERKKQIKAGVCRRSTFLPGSQPRPSFCLSSR